MTNAAFDYSVVPLKTGQRVPFTGYYTDQYGYVSLHQAHATFPPCIGRKGECAYRTLNR